MKNIIEWCNENVGFVTAILSAIGLFLSSIAVVISICTARLPYKKKLKLSCTLDYRYSDSNGSSSERLTGLSASCVNLGHRDICVTYVGLGIRNSGLKHDFVKFGIINNEIKPVIIKPTEMTSNIFDILSLSANLKPKYEKGYIYILAYDSEGKQYYKKFDRLNIVGFVL